MKLTLSLVFLLFAAIAAIPISQTVKAKERQKQILIEKQLEIEKQAEIEKQIEARKPKPIVYVSNSDVPLEIRVRARDSAQAFISTKAVMDARRSFEAGTEQTDRPYAEQFEDKYLELLATEGYRVKSIK